jgi:hypothetical protein
MKSVARDSNEPFKIVGNNAMVQKRLIARMRLSELPFPASITLDEDRFGTCEAKFENLYA